jgi:hypothetical protein
MSKELDLGEVQVCFSRWQGCIWDILARPELAVAIQSQSRVKDRPWDMNGWLLIQSSPSE